MVVVDIEVTSAQTTPTPRAASGAENASSNTTLPEVEINATHYDNGVGTSDAASEGTIHGQLVEDLPLLRPGETLESIPGMVVTQHSGDGKANQYFLRGYNLDHGTDFATRVNGVPVNMPTNAHGQGYTDLNFLIPELIERIDYRKGPYYAQDGDFASAGAADIRYRDTLDYRLANLTVGGYGFRRTLLASTFPLMQRGSGVKTAEFPAFGNTGPTLLSALELVETDGPWTIPEGMHKVNGFMRVRDGSTARGWSMNTMFYNAHWNSADQVPLSLIQTGQLDRFSPIDPTDGGNTGRAILSGEWHSSDAQDFSRISAYLQRYRLQLWSNFTYFELRPATGDQFEQKEQRNVFGGEAVKGWMHRLRGRESITEAGLQLRHDYIHVGLSNTQGRVPFEPVSDNRVHETAAGVYVQNTTYWSGWMRSVVGLRGDMIFMDVDSLNLSQNTGSARGSRLSPKLSLIFGPWRKTELFLNAGNGFHSNDARGVTEKVDPTTCVPPTSACAPPPQLIPALVGSAGREVGVRTEAIKGLQSSLALWRLDSDSELVFAADSALGNTQPNGASTRSGIEWNNHLVASRWLVLDADLSWVRARYSIMNDNGALGDYIPNAVGRVARTAVTVQRFGPWSGAFEARYIGRYPLAQDGSLWSSSSFVTNLRVQRQLSPTATLQLDVLNLFNREYYDIAYAQDFQVSPTSPVVPNGITVHPGEPRQLRLTLKFQL